MIAAAEPPHSDPWSTKPLERGAWRHASRAPKMMLLTWAFSLSLVLGACRAAAASEGDDTQVVTPPELLEFIEAPYPENTADSTIEGSVFLELTISKTGEVQGARVEQGLEPQLDELALMAARRLRFAPARRGEAAVAANILFRYDFHRPDRSAPSIATSEENDPASAPMRRGDIEHQKKEPSVPVPRSPPRHTDRPTQVQSTSNKEATRPDVASPREVTVHGRSLVDRLRTSPYAVEVVRLDESGRESSDLAQVLARVGGVTVQRRGALGSQANFTMAGLSGEQIRFFLDGVPLKYAGFPYGVANVPVNLVQRVDIYQGVVPIAFGADALGGAVDLVSHPGLRSSRAAGSYQVGSFNTHRLTALTQGYIEGSKLTARLAGFLDSSDNDYAIDVDVYDAQGRIQRDSVRRFHDGYFAAGGKLTLGTVDRPFARRLLGSVFVGTNQRDIQHSPNMTTPYGEVTFDKFTAGANVSHAVALSDSSRIDTKIGYSYVRTHFRDVSHCLYDWYGKCTWRAVRGEINQVPADRIVHDQVGFSRILLETDIAAAHTWRVSLAPTFGLRKGDDRELEGDSYDTLNRPQSVGSLVIGAELASAVLGDTLRNSAFAKSYGQLVRAEERLATGRIQATETTTLAVGGGDAIRYFLTDTVYLKASYEYAARLPDLDEYFGNGGQVVRNLGLSPERSHNLNLGAYGDELPLGRWQVRASVLGFARFSNDLIYLSTPGFYLQYQNVREARALGVEGQLAWTSPREIFGLNGNIAYQDLRNRSKSGAQATFYGDPIPNRSPLSAYAEARLRASSFALAGDVLELAFRSQYTHGFYRTWKSAGDASQKAYVSSQLAHSADITYYARGPQRGLSSSVECQNITNARLYDYFGVQRPGRAFFFKLTLEAW